MNSKGFSLVELMVTITVFAIIAAMAVPSVTSFRERALMRSTLTEMVDLIERARLQALQLDLPVTVGFDRSGDVAWCLGAVEGVVACDCFQSDPDAEDFCRLGQFPRLLPKAGAGEAQASAATGGVRMLAEPSFNGLPTFTFDPQLGELAGPTRAGSIAMASPQATDRYRARLIVSTLAPTHACSEPHNGTDITGLDLCP